MQVAATPGPVDPGSGARPMRHRPSLPSPSLRSTRTCRPKASARRPPARADDGAPHPGGNAARVAEAPGRSASRRRNHTAPRPGGRRHGGRARRPCRPQRPCAGARCRSCCRTRRGGRTRRSGPAPWITPCTRRVRAVRHGHHAGCPFQGTIVGTRPPSAPSALPVVAEACSDATYVIMLATSWGRIRRLSRDADARFSAR